MGLYTPTILGGNSYLSWFYDRGAIKDPAHTGTSKWLSQAINGGPIPAKVCKCLCNHSEPWSQCRCRNHYVTANGVRNGLEVVVVVVLGGAVGPSGAGGVRVSPAGNECVRRR